MVADRPEGPYHDALIGPLVDSFDPTILPKTMERTLSMDMGPII